MPISGPARLSGAARIWRPPGSAHRSRGQRVPACDQILGLALRSPRDRSPPRQRPRRRCSCRASAGSPLPSPQRGTGCPRPGCRCDMPGGSCPRARARSRVKAARRCSCAIRAREGPPRQPEHRIINARRRQPDLCQPISGRDIRCERAPSASATIRPQDRRRAAARARSGRRIGIASPPQPRVAVLLCGWAAPRSS